MTIKYLKPSFDNLNNARNKSIQIVKRFQMQVSS